MAEHFAHAHRVINSASWEESQKAYDEWSKEYDTSVTQLDSRWQYEAAALWSKYFGNADERTQIIDVGAGTGLVGFHLRKDFKYTGKLDMLDANMELLNVANKKNLSTRTIIVHRVNDNGVLPVKDSVYDGVFCLGSLLPNHLPPTTIEGMCKALKTGGFLIINSRTQTVGGYYDELRKVLERLQRDKIIEMVEETEVDHFRNYNPELKSRLYAMKKL